MWALGIILPLCCYVIWQARDFRKKQTLFHQELGSVRSQLEQARQDSEAWQALCAQREQLIQDLRYTLANKEEMLLVQQEEITRLAAPPKPKLYLPDPEEPSQEAVCMVYFNENTGIYHADRACAPYQAVAIPLADIGETARPCKKCAEGRLPSPAAQEAPAQEDEDDQMCLF